MEFKLKKSILLPIKLDKLTLYNLLNDIEKLYQNPNAEKETDYKCYYSLQVNDCSFTSLIEFEEQFLEDEYIKSINYNNSFLTNGVDNKMFIFLNTNGSRNALYISVNTDNLNQCKKIINRCKFHIMRYLKMKFMYLINFLIFVGGVFTGYFLEKVLDCFLIRYNIL